MKEGTREKALYEMGLEGGIECLPTWARKSEAGKHGSYSQSSDWPDMTRAWRDTKETSQKGKID